MALLYRSARPLPMRSFHSACSLSCGASFSAFPVSWQDLHDETNTFSPKARRALSWAMTGMPARQIAPATQHRLTDLFMDLPLITISSLNHPAAQAYLALVQHRRLPRSEERRVGKGCRSRQAPPRAKK